MSFPRSSGILLHPTSLPGPYGIGDFGPEAYAFADWLAAGGQSIWQMLPLGPTGYGDSPYQLFSAFAGNPLLISPELLLPGAELPNLPEEHVDFGRVAAWKAEMLARAFEKFSPDAEYHAFCLENQAWLEDYASFMALKEANGPSHVWSEWNASVKPDLRRTDAIKFEQFQFFRQFYALKRYCQHLGIRLMGDLPIYVAHDSADVWSHPENFYLENNRPTSVAGVPPDYFSATGQLWGNPIYRWEEMAQTGYRWWVERLRASFNMFDLIRLDHFRGFEAFWEVPASEKTAVNGKWTPGPGGELFTVLERELGQLPIVAENLGVITPEVEAVRERFGFPGMAVLQFAFGTDAQAASFRPHNYPRNVVAYTGTHDNDTAMGWWQSSGTSDSTRSEADVEAEKEFAREYLNTDGEEMNWQMIYTLAASVADTVIYPMQDLMGAGSEARMNTPGKASGNWGWRVPRFAIDPSVAARLRSLARIYDRLPVRKAD